MKRRVRKKKKLHPRILIMCEGETERNYFQAMKESVHYKTQLSAINPQILKAKHPAPDQIVQEAIKRNDKADKEGNPYNKVWVVFDHDYHASRKRAFNIAKKQGFGIAFSAICFEVWYLLHFERTAKQFQSEKQLSIQLKKHYINYQKAKQNDFEYLHPKLNIALKNVAWLQNQMSSNYHQHLTDKLIWTDVNYLLQELINL